MNLTEQTDCWIITMMHIYNAVISALSAHMVHTDLNAIFYTHVEHSPTVKSRIIWSRDLFSYIYSAAKGLVPCLQLIIAHQRVGENRHWRCGQPPTAVHSSLNAHTQQCFPLTHGSLHLSPLGGAVMRNSSLGVLLSTLSAPKLCTRGPPKLLIKRSPRRACSEAARHHSAPPAGQGRALSCQLSGGNHFTYLLHSHQ